MNETKESPSGHTAEATLLGIAYLNGAEFSTGAHYTGKAGDVQVFPAASGRSLAGPTPPL
jgi:hypothetical protein